MVAGIDDEVFAAFAFYGGILAFKMAVMGPLTARQRVRKGAFANMEDAQNFKVKKVTFDDSDVERVRRAHLNDMENIYLYFIISTLYMFTNPDKFIAINIFRAFSAARIAHTLAYLWQIRQPARGLPFAVGLACIFYMSYNVVTHFMYN